MRKKLYIAVYIVIITIVLTIFAGIVSFIRSTPAFPPSPEEVADTSISQYSERSNFSATTTKPEKRFPNIRRFLTGAEPFPEGCSLRFSFTPTQKAVEPGETTAYTATLINEGKDNCKNVAFSVYYTENEEFISSQPGPSASNYYWLVGDLASRKTYTMDLLTKIIYKIDENKVSEACATADNSKDICSESVVFVEKNASDSSSLTQKIKVPTGIVRMWGQMFNKKQFGIWVWDSVTKMNPTYAKEVITVSKENGFNTVYLTIDDYLQVVEMKDELKRKDEKEKYMKALFVFVSASLSTGIKVDVVGGAKDWAMKEHRWKGYALIDFVKEYNEKYPQAQIRNFQYDVEPYLLSDYAVNKVAVLKDFIEFIDESAFRMRATNAGFSVVIPHFYDSNQNWTDVFTYNGEEAHAFTHLLKILKQKENTEIIIMAYRNFFDENNGVKQISEPEILEASNSEYTTKIIIAQETGNVSPEYVTYYNQPKDALFDGLHHIQSYFASYKNFGGMAVHYFDSFLKME